MRRIAPRIFRWALARTGDPDDADDVTQEVLVRLSRSLPSYAGRGSFEAWLFRITMNRAATFSVRRNRRRQVRLEAAGALATSSPPPGMAGEACELAHRFLRDLSIRQREVFDLVDLQGLTPAEAAAWLGIEASTARVHLLHARRRMRRWILEATDNTPDRSHDL